jgi:hypothetical protein
VKRRAGMIARMPRQAPQMAAYVRLIGQDATDIERGEGQPAPTRTANAPCVQFGSRASSAPCYFNGSRLVFASCYASGSRPMTVTRTRLKISHR